MMNEQEGMERTPKSSSTDIKIEEGENGVVYITIPRDLPVYLKQTGSNDSIYMHLTHRTVYDVDKTQRIAVLTDRKTTHSTYIKSKKKHRRYQWGK